MSFIDCWARKKIEMGLYSAEKNADTLQRIRQKRVPSEPT
jgi:hypothetical protein